MPLLKKKLEAATPQISFLCFLFFLLFPSCLVAGGSSHWRNWDTAIIQGPLSNDEKVRYFLQPLLGFEDNHYKFNRVFAYVGAGYQFVPDGIVWLMVGSYYDKRNNGEVERVNTLRQQFNWRWLIQDGIIITNTTRLEERRNTKSPSMAYRIRQMFLIRAPFQTFPDYSLVMFNELFFNLNNPSWVNSNSFFEQNRAFVGLGRQFTKEIGLDVGYLNQTSTHRESQRNNVFYLALNVIH